MTHDLEISLPESATTPEVLRGFVNTLRHTNSNYDSLPYTLENFVAVTASIAQKFPDLSLESQIQIARKLSMHHGKRLVDVYNSYLEVQSFVSELPGYRPVLKAYDVIVCAPDGNSPRFCVVLEISKGVVKVCYRTSANSYNRESTIRASEAMPVSRGFLVK